MPPIRLGAFELRSPLARGGMGEVWRARHVQTNLPVVVKVITEEAARLDSYITFFANEVRAVARLTHPGITHVFDHGKVGLETEEGTEGRMVAGSPYLVMEMAGGSLDQQLGRPLSWTWIQPVLMSLLDALAHAHAHGVIHRDLKPPNVLTFQHGVLKLTDFGIAHAVGEATRTHMVGTPEYMSPEQITGRWRDYGPWTDLYALGCMAWQMVTGKPPFGTGNLSHLKRAHLSEEPPPLAPRAPVPPGLEAWLRQLMDKSPAHRFRRAADAAWALQGLGPVDPNSASTPVVSQPEPAVYETFSLSVALSAMETPQFSLAEEELPTPEPTSPPIEFRRPPIPSVWETPNLQELPPLLRDVGLGLFGIRTIPFVGRKRERTVLWQALQQAAGNGSARLVVVHGEAGIGKTRLANWVATRAHEVGAAQVIRIQHDPETAPDEVLRKTMQAQLQLTPRMLKNEIAQRVREVVPAWPEADRESLLRWVTTPEPLGEEQGFSLIERWLRDRAESRPLVMVFDDVHWCPQALRLAHGLLRRWTNQPQAVLILLTTRQNEIARTPGAAPALQALMTDAGARRLVLGPLDPVARTELVRELLGLEEDLAARVEQRSGGNPMFTIALVGSWVSRGALERGPGGFRLRTGEEVRLPDDLLSVARERLQQAVVGLEDKAWTMMERAAVLGLEVDEHDWQEACDVPFDKDWHSMSASRVFSPARARIRAQVVDRLLAAQLVEETDIGFRFSQTALREALVSSASQHERLQPHHQACGAVLSRQEDIPPERVGRHLLAAGHHDDAASLLLEGLMGDNHRRTRSQLGLVGEVDRALRLANAPEADPRWGALFVRRVQLLRADGDLASALRWANKAQHAATRHGWADHRGPAMLEKGLTLWDRGDAAQAEQLLEQTQSLVQDDAVQRCRCLRALSRCASANGESQRALDLLQAAHDAATEAEAPLEEAKCLLHRVRFLPPAEAQSVIAEALALYEHHGTAWNLATCHDMLARTWRDRGDLPRAEMSARHAIQLLDDIETGGSAAIEPRLTLALVHLQRDQADEALDLAHGARRWGIRAQRPRTIALADAILVVVATLLERTHDWEVAFNELADTLRRVRQPDPDIAWCLERAGKLAVATQEFHHAGRALALALELYQDLGMGPRAEQVQDLLNSVRENTDSSS